jgi:hypothetical protein
MRCSAPCQPPAPAYGRRPPDNLPRDPILSLGKVVYTRPLDLLPALIWETEPR